MPNKRFLEFAKERANKEIPEDKVNDKTPKPKNIFIPTEFSFLEGEFGKDVYDRVKGRYGDI